MASEAELNEKLKNIVAHLDVTTAEIKNREDAIEVERRRNKVLLENWDHLHERDNALRDTELLVERARLCDIESAIEHRKRVEGHFAREVAALERIAAALEAQARR